MTWIQQYSSSSELGASLHHVLACFSGCIIRGLLWWVANGEDAVYVLFLCLPSLWRQCVPLASLSWKIHTSSQSNIVTLNEATHVNSSFSCPVCVPMCPVRWFLGRLMTQRPAILMHACAAGENGLSVCLSPCLVSVEAEYKPMEEGDEVLIDFDEDDFDESEDFFSVEGKGQDDGRDEYGEEEDIAR